MLKICQINVAWEANNFTPTSTKWNLHHSKTLSKSFSLAKNEFDKKPSYNGIVSPALLKTLITIQKQNADVILLQEFQVYFINSTSSVEFMLSTILQNKYELCSIALSNNTPPIASIVLVKSSILNTWEDVSGTITTVCNDAIVFKKAFTQARMIAGAIARITYPDGIVRSVLLISSHSHHRIPWDKTYSQQMLTSLYKFYGGKSKKPLQLVWGGDFNARVQWGGVLKFGNLNVFKYKPSKKTLHSNYNEGLVDWLFATSIHNKNPIEVNIIDVPSDHRMVVSKTTSRYIDNTIVYKNKN